MAYLMKRKLRNQKRWVVVWIDYRKGRGSKGKREVYCDKHGATNDLNRRKLLNKYQKIEDEIKAEVLKFGSKATLKDKSALELIHEFLLDAADLFEAKVVHLFRG